MVPNGWTPETWEKMKAVLRDQKERAQQQMDAILGESLQKTLNEYDPNKLVLNEYDKEFFTLIGIQC